MKLLRVLFPNPAGDPAAPSDRVEALQRQYSFSHAYAAHLSAQNGFRVFALEGLEGRERYLADAEGDTTPTFDFAQLYSTDEIPDAQARIGVLSRWFVSIGKGYGGDQYAEVLRGAYKGAVVHLNHEQCLGVSSPAALAAQYDDFEEFGVDFRALSSDEKVDFLVSTPELDLVTVVAPNVDAFLAECLFCDAERLTGQCVPAKQGASTGREADKEAGVAKAPTSESLRPSDGHVAETGQGNWWSLIQELVGLDFDEALGEAGEYFTRDEKPAVIVGGDVHVEGDVSSAALAEGKEGYRPDDDRDSFTMIVLGDLTVTGTLDVVQNAQLLVTGSVKARVVRGCSANLVAKGTIEAEELVVFEQSEEGGLLFGETIRTPLLVQLGSELDLETELEVEGETASDAEGEQKRALTRAAAALTRQPEAAHGLRLYNQIADLIIKGEAQGFADAYRAELSGVGAAVSIPVAEPGAAVPLFDVQTKDSRATLCGVTVDGDRIYAAGGLGANVALASDDGGRVVRELSVGVGTGLRKFLFDGDTLYVCGERGMLARSTDGGASFERIEAGATICMNTILRADGALWACGDFGAYKSSDDGETWSKVAVEGEITRPQDSRLGGLLPSDKGYLYIARDGEVRKSSLDAGVALWAACATNKETILAVGDGGAIHRSTDGGVTFEKIASGVTASLENVACTRGGLIVAVGLAGVILRSTDDGASFERVAQPYTDGGFFGAAPFGDQVLVAGAERLLLTVG